MPSRTQATCRQVLSVTVVVLMSGLLPPSTLKVSLPAVPPLLMPTPMLVAELLLLESVTIA